MSEAPVEQVSQQVGTPQAVTEDQWVQKRREARMAERAQERQAEEPAPVSEPDPEPELESDPEPETTEAEAEDVTRTAELLSEEVEPEAEEATAETDPSEGEQAEFPGTVRELAESLEFDPSDLAEHLTMTVNPNGQTQDVTLAEMAKGYMREADYTRAKMELAEERRSFDDVSKQALERQKQSIAQLDTVAVALAQQIDMGPDDAEIARIGREEPHRYPQVVEERKQRVEAFNKAQAARKQAMMQAEEQNRDTMARYRADQQKRLADAMPAMKDPTEARKVEDTIRKFLTASDIGFTDQEVTDFINGPFDHRQVLVIARAAEAAAQGEVKKAVQKKVKKLPKLSKSKARQPKRQQGERLRSAKQRLKTDQSVEAGIELLKSRRLARRNATHGGSQ